MRGLGAGLAGVVAALMAATSAAHAYIGPGSGLAALGSLLALAGAAVLAVFGFVWFPIKRLIKRRNGKQHQDTKPTALG
jgi:hypothetical protein